MASNREIRIPAASILALRATLRREVGARAATTALQEAGHAAGDALYDRLAHNDSMGETPGSTFWIRLSSLFREMGWGTVEHQEAHAGVGALVARDWFEVDPAASTPTCPFSTGVLSSILGRVAGRDVSVMVVPCPDGGDACCRFLFGAAPVLQKVYAGLREGEELETALSVLS
jgi:predicted hydrocarbon binding protein